MEMSAVWGDMSRGRKVGHTVSIETREKISMTLSGRSYVALGRRNINDPSPMTATERTKKWKKAHPNYQREYRARNPGKVAGYCKAWRAKDPVKTKHLHKKAYYKEKYGITLEELQQILDSQDSKCAICKDIIKFEGKTGAHLDHDADTGKIRGALCSHCNPALGH